MSKKYKSNAISAIHETMAALHDAWANDKQTMRHFDEACLEPTHPMKPEEIKEAHWGFAQVAIAGCEERPGSRCLNGKERAPIVIPPEYAYN